MKDIANRAKAAVIAIYEAKLDRTVLHSDFHTGNYKIIRFNKFLHKRGVACYKRSDAEKINEHNTFDILKVHTKPITIGTTCRFLNQSNFFTFLKKIYQNSTQT